MHASLQSVTNFDASILRIAGSEFGSKFCRTDLTGNGDIWLILGLNRSVVLDVDLVMTSRFRSQITQ